LSHSAHEQKLIGSAIGHCERLAVVDGVAEPVYDLDHAVTVALTGDSGSIVDAISVLPLSFSTSGISPA
jgi:hypothetical protein